MNIYQQNKKAINEDNEIITQLASKGYCDEDSWNICDWFIRIMSNMLEDMLKDLKGCPDEYNDIPIHEYRKSISYEDNEMPDMAEWRRILERMLFLLNEMDPNKCSYKNPFQEDLVIIERILENRYVAVKEHIDESYLQLINHQFEYQEQLIWHYRDRCREEFFNLFSKWFWHLWN